MFIMVQLVGMHWIPYRVIEKAEYQAKYAACQKLLLENTKVQLCLQFFSYGGNFSKSVTCTGNMKGKVNSLISGRIGILYPAGCPVGTGYLALRLAGYPAGRISGIISIRCTHLQLGGPFQYRLCSSLVT